MTFINFCPTHFSHSQCHLDLCAFPACPHAEHWDYTADWCCTALYSSPLIQQLMCCFQHSFGSLYVTSTSPPWEDSLDSFCCKPLWHVVGKVTKCSLPALVTLHSSRCPSITWNQDHTVEFSEQKDAWPSHDSKVSSTGWDFFWYNFRVICRIDVLLHYSSSWNPSGSLPGDRGGNTCLEVCFTPLLIESIFLTLCALWLSQEFSCINLQWASRSVITIPLI